MTEMGFPVLWAHPGLAPVFFPGLGHGAGPRDLSRKHPFATPTPPKALPAVSIMSSDSKGKRGENNLSLLQQGGKPARAEAQ